MLSAMLDDRRPVYVAGRRFLLRRVSLADVLRVCAILGQRSSLVKEISVEAGQKVLESISRLELAEILSWLMEPADPLWLGENLTPEVLRDLVEAIEAMNDLGSIFQKLNLAGIKPESPGGPQEARTGEGKGKGPSGLEIAVEVVARRYGRPPHEVMGWPVEEFLEILDIVDAELEAMPKFAERAGASRWTAGRTHANDVPDGLLGMMGGESGHKVN